MFDENACQLLHPCRFLKKYCHNGLTYSPLMIGVYMIKYGSVTKYDVPVILKSKNNDILISIDDYPNLLC